MTRQFKFNGYHKETFFGEGEFTEGKVYSALTLEYYTERNNIPPDGLFADDSGTPYHEELQYFTEVFDG